ncbi:hypothetical protein KR059_000518 [Drosophila kikkawai]|nr:hypothetical protein KR059_000518 [Drosophila kikkawai]
MCWAAMARKDDPVFNVRFVQFVEGEPCLWNYTHPGYSKKEEVQRAWQQVANEIKDTVRNCRERWRTIRSSFLRSLKLARTQTGRGKRKYYLSKYLQFLIPYTKSRSCHKQLTPTSLTTTGSAAGMVLRKPGSNPFPLPADQLEDNEEEEEEETKESGDEMPLDVQVSEEEEEVAVNQSREEHHQQQQQEDQQHRAPPTACLPLRLQAIKVEQPSLHPPPNPNANPQLDKIVAHQSLVTVPAAALGSHMDWQDLTHWLKGSTTAVGNHHHQHHHKISTPTPPPPPPVTPAQGGLPPGSMPMAMPMSIPSPDADYSFLISLHPYLKEMSGKQNRRFRQKVVGLIDNVLDNIDV